MNLSTPLNSFAGVKSIPLSVALSDAPPPFSGVVIEEMVSVSKSASVSFAKTLRLLIAVSNCVVNTSSFATGIDVDRFGSNFEINPSVSPLND